MNHMNDLPPIITAEAAVKSKRSGFVSIFDPQKDVTKIQDIKQLYADPQLMKEAVAELKKAGFRVMRSDRISLAISGPVELFEQQFNVTIISTKQGLTCEGVTQIGYIDTDKSAFSGVLAGIALAQKAIMNGATPPPKVKGKRYPLSPSEVPSELGAKELSPGEILNLLLTRQVHNRQVRVAVIDTGFHEDHPYFTANNKERLGNVKLNIIRGSTDEFTLQLAQKIDKIKSLIEEAFDIKDLAPTSSLPKEDIQDKVAELTNKLITSLGKTISKNNQDFLKNKPTLDQLIKYMAQIMDGYVVSKKAEIEVATKPDYDGHGTMVTSLLLIFIQNTGVALDICKTPLRSIENSFFTVLARKPDIVTCSLGAAVPKSETTTEYLEKGPAIRKKYYQEIKTAADEGRTIIFATGNIAEAKENLRVLEPQWPFVIAVGGAYRGPDPTDIIASNICQGYAVQDRFVPDVCGLVGSEDEELHVLPIPPDEWEVADGSSLAAPQIAGMCVFIKMIYPAANWQEMKYILTRSCDEINSGESADGVKLGELETSFPDGIIKGIGLANIKGVLILAILRAAEAAKAHNKKATIRK
jgi:subtilisin family serine protease